MSTAFDTFHVKVVEAKNVAACDRGGTSDPYCILKTSFSRQAFKTSIHFKTILPKWNEEFRFFVHLAEGEIIVNMFDHNQLMKDHPMGDFTIKLSEYADGLYHEKWFPLSNEPMEHKKENKTTGEALLVVWYTGPNSTPEIVMEKKKQKEIKAAKPVEVKKEKKEEKKPAPKGNLSTPDEENTAGLKVEDVYEMGKQLGTGAFSVVQLATRKKDGKKFAIKCVSKTKLPPSDLLLLSREISIMKKLKHPHIIQLVQVFETDDMLYLVLEYATGGELFDSIVNKGSYGEEDAALIIQQIMEAITYVHSNGIAHRDLKPENLLLAGDSSQKPFIKIADFGLSKDFGMEGILKTRCGTPDYVAPEVVMGEEYNTEVDVWSIGVITYTILCGYPPFFGDSNKELFDKIISGKYSFTGEWDKISSEAKTFIKKMLVVDPNSRYTAEQALQDPWIKKYAVESMSRSLTLNVEKFKAYTKKYKEQQ